MKYRKKPVIIDAVQFDGIQESRKRAIINLHMPHGSYKYMADRTFPIITLEGTMIANPGDWIIKGVKGEFYPCKPDVFDMTYEVVEVPDTHEATRNFS